MPWIDDSAQLRRRFELREFSEHAEGLPVEAMVYVQVDVTPAYGLLEAAGRTMRPILLKRGLSSTIEEWLLSAEYILGQGNSQVVLCERGIRTFETYTRNTLDLSAAPLVKELSHLPVVIDPSHGTGKWSLVAPMALAALAAEAAGLMVEVHPHPEHALSDGSQSLTPRHFGEMMERLRLIAGPLGRSL